MRKLAITLALAVFLTAGTNSQEQEAPQCNGVKLPLRLTTGSIRLNPTKQEIRIGDIHFITRVNDGTYLRLAEFFKKQAIGLLTTLDVRLTERHLPDLNVTEEIAPVGRLPIPETLYVPGKMMPTYNGEGGYKIFQYTDQGKDYQFTFFVTDPHLSELIDKLTCKPKLQFVFAVPNGT